jgi:type I restriction enzyme S subunit
MDWVPFDQVAECNPRVSLKRGGESEYVDMADVSPSRRYIGPSRFREYKGSGSRFENADTLFARITPCLQNGKVAQYIGKNPSFGSTEFFVFRAREGISDAGYVYYLASSDILRGPAEKSMVGASGRQRADLNVVKGTPVPAPPLPVQKRIADILSAYDDLIENNRRRIQILEEMARNLYREWFVKFRFPIYRSDGTVERIHNPETDPMIDSPLGPIPQGWKTENVLDVAEVRYGFAFKSRKFSEQNIGMPVIRIRDIPKGESKTYTQEKPDKDYLVTNGDILVGMDGDFHMTRWSGGDAYQNQRVARFSSHKPTWNAFLFQALIDPIHFFNSTITGTTVAHLGHKHIKTIEVLMPPEKYRNHLMDGFSSIDSKSLILKLSIRNLKTSRDLLLPRLVSGQLDVFNTCPVESVQVAGVDNCQRRGRL